ncbi:hypothetical protein LTS18_012047 [Coniosporium uncinatum]|uniref:Uncharacterized protein n=1 Tax=Coniosporium uncinatum TaxID=93489 RepID=A0ACC3DJQ4_9PEZI|nr:hypothetical protein LTS18_012047 [Coniosporium uncinatum]
MKGMDFVLVEMNLNKVSPLRDSISTVLSSERSMSNSVVDTPGSSPASSVILNSRKGSDQGNTTPHGNGKFRRSSFASNQKSTSIANKRLSSLPVSRKPLYTPSKPTIPPADSPSSPSALSQRTDSRAGFRSTSDTTTTTPSANKPRWNASPNMNATVVGHNFKPLSATDPSPYRRQVAGGCRRAVTTCGGSGLPVPSPLGKTTSSMSLFSRPGSSVSTGRPGSGLSNGFASSTRQQQQLLQQSQPKANAQARMIGPPPPQAHPQQHQQQQQQQMIGPQVLSPAPAPAPATPRTLSKLAVPRLRAMASLSQLPKTRTPGPAPRQSSASTANAPPATTTMASAGRQRRQSTVYGNNSLNTPLAPAFEYTARAAAREEEAETESPSVRKVSRPESRTATASGRRSSMLPTPRGVSGGGGRLSRIGLPSSSTSAAGRMSSLGVVRGGGEEGERPRWKP